MGEAGAGRLFVALNFNARVLGGLAALREGLRAAAVRGRFTPDANLHLTLAFLGECSHAQASAAKGAMDALTFAPFDVTVTRVGFFSRGGGQIWWAGLEETEALMGLQRRLVGLLAKAGLPLEARRYTPHITLAREASIALPPGACAPFGQTVTCAELMRSERAGGRLVYTSIHKREAI
jgi:2'-5' RNA ligase